MAEGRRAVGAGSAVWAGSAVGGPSEPAEMRALRRRIDALDRRIVRLLNERVALGLAVGQAKAAAGRSVRDGEREQAVLERVAAANGGPLPGDDLLALYRRLVAATRRLELAERRRELAERRRAEDARTAPEP